MTDIDKPVAALMALGVASIVSKQVQSKQDKFKEFKFNPPSIKKLN